MFVNVQNQKHATARAELSKPAGETVLKSGESVFFRDCNCWQSSTPVVTKSKGKQFSLN